LPRDDRSTKLGRSVAVKLLPAALARDAERVARFEREARVPPHRDIDGRLHDRYTFLEFVPGEPAWGKLDPRYWSARVHVSARQGLQGRVHRQPAGGLTDFLRQVQRHQS
jgi:hypothetical protein